MMHTYFISDLHLSDDRPDMLRAFVRFMRDKAPSADAVYILGDLFEIWVGDDDTNPTARQVAQEIATLASLGVPCYLIRGNRDFLLGRPYAGEARLILLEDEECINIYGRNTLILHGDTLCSDDFTYQEFRRRVHKPWLQRLFLALPLFVRLRVAARMRHASKQEKQGKEEATMDVNHHEVSRRFKQRHIDWMIHGHTHRPAVHSAPDGKGKRIVLGDWHQQAYILKVTPEDFEIQQEPL